MARILRFLSGYVVAAGCVLVASAPARGDSKPSFVMRRAIEDIEQSASSVRQELRAARLAGDPYRARCASDKLSEVHAQLRLALQQTSGSDQRRRQFALDMARNRAREIARDARHCRGTELRTRVVAKRGAGSS